MLTESDRRAVFTKAPLLSNFLGTMLQDLQHTENDEACTEDREPRDIGTIWDCPEQTFEAALAICDTFQLRAPIAESSQSYDMLGSDLYMESVGRGVGFSDREHDSDPDTSADIAARLSDAVGNVYVEPYVGDDGKAYLA